MPICNLYYIISFWELIIVLSDFSIYLILKVIVLYHCRLIFEYLKAILFNRKFLEFLFFANWKYIVTHEVLA
jgi:hypothetical protein